jgi:hypothetical protein
MGRRKRDGNHSPQKNNLIQIQREIKKMDSKFLTPTKQRKMTRNPAMPTKKNLKEEILQVIIENFMEKILLDTVN